MIRPAPLLTGRSLHDGQLWIAMDTGQPPLAERLTGTAAGLPPRSKERMSSCAA